MKTFQELLQEMPYLTSGTFKWTKSSSSSHTSSAFERMYDVIGTVSQDGVHYFFVVPKDQLVRIGRIFIKEKDRFVLVGEVKFKATLTFKLKIKKLIQVDGANLAAEFQSRGLISRLYLFLIEDGYTIASDATQFPPGAGLWKRIARESTDLGLKVRLFNGEQILQKDGYDIFYNGSNIPDSVVWTSGDDYRGFDTVLIASK